MRSVIASTVRELVTASCTECPYGEQKGSESGPSQPVSAVEHALATGHTVHERIVSERTIGPGEAW